MASARTPLPPEAASIQLVGRPTRVMASHGRIGLETCWAQVVGQDGRPVEGVEMRPYSWASFPANVVFVVVLGNGKVELVEELHAHSVPGEQFLLNLAGGSVEEGQTPEEAAKAEMREELGRMLSRTGKLEPLETAHLMSPWFRWRDPGFHAFLVHGSVEVEREARHEPEWCRHVVWNLDELAEALLDGRASIAHPLGAQIILGLWQDVQKGRRDPNTLQRVKSAEPQNADPHD